MLDPVSLYSISLQNNGVGSPARRLALMQSGWRLFPCQHTPYCPLIPAPICTHCPFLPYNDSTLHPYCDRNLWTVSSWGCPSWIYHNSGEIILTCNLNSNFLVPNFTYLFLYLFRYWYRLHSGISMLIHIELHIYILLLICVVVWTKSSGIWILGSEMVTVSKGTRGCSLAGGPMLLKFQKPPASRVCPLCFRFVEREMSSQLSQGLSVRLPPCFPPWRR